jgi:phosphatidylglycerol:prolipoprotein diacylglycerol transferase
MLPKFTIFSLTIKSYRAAALLSAVVGFSICFIMLRRKRYTVFEIFSLFGIIAIGFFIGARLLNVLLNFSNYMEYPQKIITFKLTGFSVVGGAIGTSLMCLIYLKLRKKDIYAFFDSVAIPFLVSFPIMKLGCFLNGCCYGKPTDSIFGVVFKSKYNNSINGIFSLLKSFAGVPQKVYPTQLFEAGLVLLFLPIVVWIYKRGKYKKGHLFAITVLGFISIRLLVHFFREFPYPKFIVNVAYPLFYVAILVATGIWLYADCKKD